MARPPIVPSPGRSSGSSSPPNWKWPWSGRWKRPSPSGAPSLIHTMGVKHGYGFDSQKRHFFHVFVINSNFGGIPKMNQNGYVLHVRWGCTAYGFDIVDEYCANFLFARQNHLQHVRWNISVVPSFRSTRHLLWTWENMPKRRQTNGFCLKTGYPKIQWSLIQSSYFP